MYYNILIEISKAKKLTALLPAVMIPLAAAVTTALLAVVPDQALVRALRDSVNPKELFLKTQNHCSLTVCIKIIVNIY